MEDLRYVSLPAELAAISEVTSAIQFAMASEPLVGALLRTLAASKPAGRFLELGTGTGIATAWLLSGMDQNSTLVSGIIVVYLARGFGNSRRAGAD